MTKTMYFDPLVNFPDWLRTHLDAHDMSIMDLSRKSGIPDNSIRGYLNYNHEPSLFAVCCLCGALGYTVGAVPNGNK